MNTSHALRMNPVILLFGLTISSLPLMVAAQTDSLRAEAAARNDRLMEEIMLRALTPGMSAAVGVGGKVVWAGGYGFADLEQDVPVDEETMFRIGSVSKPMTAAAVGILVQEGKLDVDAPVQTYLPDFPEKRWPITTREVAGHIAGIRHYRDDEFLSADRYATVEAGLEIFKDDTLLFEPGERFSYSSYGWNLVSAVVEAAAETPFLEFMQERVFDPMGLNHTAADWTDRVIPNRSSFYEVREDGHAYNAPFVDNSYKWAGGGFLSAPSDMVRFAMAHAPGGLFETATLDELWTPLVLDNGDTTSYAVGWAIGADSEGRRIVSHGGGSIGGTTFLLYYPDENVAAAIVANSRGPTTPQAAEALAAPFLNPAVLGADAPASLSGTYECQVQASEEETHPLTLHLLGGPDTYWGRAQYQGRNMDIVNVHTEKNTVYITTVEDGGWTALLRLDLTASGITGQGNGRPVTCTLDKPQAWNIARSVLDEYEEALTTGSGLKVAEVFHPDAKILPQGKAVVRGLAGVASHFSWLESVNFKEEFEIVEVIPAADHVVVQTENRGSWTDSTDGSMGIFSTKGMMTLKRDPGGAWKIYRYAYNENPTEVATMSRVAEVFNHTVFFWLKEPDNQEHRAAFEKSLTTFIKNSKHVRSMHVGTPAGTDRPVIDSSYTYCLALTFDSREDQDAYQIEPGHLKFIEESSDLWEKVVVYDSVNLLAP